MSNKPKVFSDLEKAIVDLVNSPGVPKGSPDDPMILVGRYELKVLIAESNLAFREPEDDQICL